MSAQFMPGPWHASEMTMDAKSWASLNSGHELTIVRANWDGFSGDVIAAVWADDDHDELATARLIAAAPAMYAALAAICAEFANNHPLIKEGRAALAVADGEQS